MTYSELYAALEQIAVRFSIEVRTSRHVYAGMVKIKTDWTATHSEKPDFYVTASTAEGVLQAFRDAMGPGAGGSMDAVGDARVTP